MPAALGRRRICPQLSLSSHSLRFYSASQEMAVCNLSLVLNGGSKPTAL